MKDSHLINYKLFCDRTGFDIKIIFNAIPELNYSEFCEMLRKKSTCPPDIDYFEKEKQNFLELKKIIVKEKEKKVEKAKINIELDTNSELLTKKPTTKTKRTRKSRARKKDD